MNTYNNQTFPTTNDAATALAQPFLTGTSTNNYSYGLLTSTIMQNRFGIDKLVWSNGGPDLGYVIDNSQPGGYQAGVDCSGFVARVLSAVYPNGNASLYDDIVIQNGQLQNYQTPQHPQPFPSAEDYANFFARIANQQQGPWQTITCNAAIQGAEAVQYGSMNHAQPGDILAYSLQPPSTDTGHVMVISSIQPLVQGQANTPYWPTDLTEFTSNGLQFYAVTVFDSSNVQHWNDSRQDKATGVGKGTILIVANAQGIPVAFQFNKNFVLLTVGNTNYATDLQIGQLQTLAIGRGG